MDVNETAPATPETPKRERQLVDVLKPETCPPSLRKFYNDDQRSAIAAALEAGNIVAEVKQVKVSKEKAKSNEDEFWPYVNYRAVKQPGMTALAGGKAAAAVKISPEDYDKLDENGKKRADNDRKDGACDYFNYGFGLTLTQPIRVMLTNSLGGVDKEIDKQITQIMKTGLFGSEDAARAFIIKQRSEMGLEIPNDGD